MALRLAETEPDRTFDYVCTPTQSELPEMTAHFDRLESLLGAPIRRLTTESLPGLIFEQRALPNPRMRWCTRLLKIEPFKAYLTEHLPAVVYVGIRADEAERGGVYTDDEAVEEQHPLVEWGWGLDDVVGYLTRRDAMPPWRTDCYQCPFQTLGEWWILWKNYPDLYAQAEAQEAFVSTERGRDHTFRSDSRDSWPASLRGLRERFEAGAVPLRGKVKPRQYQPDIFLGTTLPDLMAERTGMCRVCTL